MKFYACNNITPADDEGLQEVPNPGEYTDLVTGDVCLAWMTIGLQMYDYDSTDATAESLPDVITPTGNTGNGRWTLRETIDHEYLSGLLGGAADDHYHLTLTQHSDLTDTGDCTIHDHDGISENTSARHTQGTDTTLGTMTADIDMDGSFQVVGLQAPAAAGEALRQTTNITEADLEQLTDGSDTTLHDHDGISENTAARHTQGTDTTLGTMTADVNMGSSYQLTNLAAPAASGEAIRQTTNVTEANLNTLTGGGDTTLHDHDGISENTAHRTASGAQHSYIDQDVTSGSTPTFTGTNFTGIPMAGILSADKTGSDPDLVTGTKAASADDLAKWNGDGDLVTADVATSELGVLASAREWTAQQGFNKSTLTDAATIAWDTDSNQVCKVTITADRTMGAPTNMTDGGWYTLEVIQDGTGGWTLSWNAVFKFEGGIAPTLASGAGERTIITFESDGTNFYGAPHWTE